jgi:hydrogenase maturation protein HypF
MSQSAAKDGAIVALRLTLTGRVQGIGVRPAVARFAAELALDGSIRNTRRGVEVHVEGGADRVAQFENELAGRLPSAARVERVEREAAPPTACESFEILASGGDAPVAARVPIDAVACAACLDEVASGDDRRHAYAFTSCTDCGPRYSILETLPYEREQTSMAPFAMCPQCRTEYASPADRRFHAQTNACPACGPRVTCRDARGRALATESEAIEAAAQAIREGRIVALRGLGGYQLIVDATSPEAVRRLRQRKQRHGKPLAVMVASLDRAEQLAVLDSQERQLLQGEAGPVVVARARAGSSLAAAVAPDMNTIGVMLPTTPLHAVLLRACRTPLVVTSGNREGEPLAYDARQAQESLSGIADLYLDHDRAIRRSVDDSVVRVMAGRAVTLRLARGLAPLPLQLSATEAICALGGHQKVALALSNGEQALLGPHLGDMDSLPARERFEKHYDDLHALYGVAPRELVTDAHPDYFTRGWAEQQRLPRRSVQHHHAHVVAGMLEHGWLERTVLGVAFDGTGYGDDGTIWGGEMLLTTATGFRRAGRLRPFPLPGGEKAVREPWRVAVALVHEACGAESAAALTFGSGDAPALLPVLRSRRFSPLTSSAGRLFDGVAALALGIERCQYEGQAAVLLEAVCDETEPGSYRIDVREDGLIELDWRPLVQAVLRDRNAGLSPGAIAMRFHRGLALAIVALATRYAHLPVVLGGGVFQNRILVELLDRQFASMRQPLGLPGVVPPGDGGLAAGQLAVALACGQQTLRGDLPRCV